MSRRIKTLSGSLAIAVVAVTIAAASAADVLQNGGFEIGGGAPAAWTITQTAAPLGDFNGDNTVDAADYVMWRKGGPIFNEVSDVGVVTSQDYTDWRANYGHNTPAFASATELVDFANAPAPAAGEYGLFIRSTTGSNPPAFEMQNRTVDVVLTQTVPAVANKTFTFTGNSLLQGYSSNFLTTLDPSAPNGAFPSPTVSYFEVAFLNASNQVLGTQQVDLRTDNPGADVWQTHTFTTGLSPTGTSQIRVSAVAKKMVASCTAAGCALGQDVYFDNFSLIQNGLFSPGDLLGADKGKNGNLDTVGAPANWSVVKTAEDNIQFSTASFAIHTGNVGMWLRSFAGGDAKAVQTVNGVAGGHYTFSGFSKWETGYSGADPSSPTQTFMTMEFLDGASTPNVLGTQSLDLRTVQINDGTFRQFSLNGTAPAGTVTVRVSAGATAMANSGINPQSAMFDDFALLLGGSGANLLTAGVPEPASLGLMLLGLAVGAAYRRRSA